MTGRRTGRRTGRKRAELVDAHVGSARLEARDAQQRRPDHRSQVALTQPERLPPLPQTFPRDIRHVLPPIKKVIDDNRTL